MKSELRRYDVENFVEASAIRQCLNEFKSGDLGFTTDAKEFPMANSLDISIANQSSNVRNSISLDNNKEMNSTTSHSKQRIQSTRSISNLIQASSSGFNRTNVGNKQNRDKSSLSSLKSTLTQSTVA